MSGPSTVGLRWRGPLTDEELFELTRSHGGRPVRGWWDRIRPHSLGWVTARDADGTLLGFVNVAWDGGVHAFLLDTTVHPDFRRQSIGRRLIEHAISVARDNGMRWLHVDFEPPPRDFYRSRGFGPTEAGLIRLAE